ncbi:MAG: DUF3380 domain-containing protein [Pandoraea sp.]|nr:MAG: DUF3380 domain-containing protein [Pandoraea sp.]TAM17082.1 MAG: DUF3380 domain-containing protein [Pandoraea sp.]
MTEPLHPARLTEADLQAAAERLGVRPATVRAVIEVESRGRGFLPDGRPVILFERHVMYRTLKTAGHDADALAARHPNVVNRRRGGYRGGAAEHARLARASDIDPDCALASASWGLFQIMGFHWRRLGYPSVAALAKAMGASEGEQLDAFARFIETDPALHRALGARQWATFARAYNGPAYRANRYDEKLAHAYERHANRGRA